MLVIFANQELAEKSLKYNHWPHSPWCVQYVADAEKLSIDELRQQLQLTDDNWAYDTGI